MLQRRSLKLPITLGVVLIVLVILLTTGWVLLSVFGALSSKQAYVYWTLLSVGSVLFVALLVGVVMYLWITVQTINLTKRQTNFMDSITHELKSPIASLKLHLQTLSRREMPEVERKAFYGHMLEDLARLDELISHLLEAARVDRSEAIVEIEDVDLRQLIQNSAKYVTARHGLPEETISLDGNEIMVRGRRVDLEMVFRNLLDNAVKYAGSPPKVEVTLRQKGKRAVIEVSDNGAGIPLHMRRAIFKRFVRVGDELERTKPGTGLGLYIVRTLVSSLRGRIRVLSGRAGVGTTFEVDLPVALSSSAK